MEALLVSDDLHCAQGVGAEIVALQHLAKAALAQDAEDLFKQCAAPEQSKVSVGQKPAQVVCTVSKHLLVHEQDDCLKNCSTIPRLGF
eukprot:scaffold103303_cov18-Tisochrysis_lutea.AAC.1